MHTRAMVAQVLAAIHADTACIVHTCGTCHKQTLHHQLQAVCVRRSQLCISLAMHAASHSTMPMPMLPSNQSGPGMGNVLVATVIAVPASLASTMLLCCYILIASAVRVEPLRWQRLLLCCCSAPATTRGCCSIENTPPPRLPSLCPTPLGILRFIGPRPVGHLPAAPLPMVP